MLGATVARLETLVADLVAQVDDRIAELEKLLEESRRPGKRQAAPSSNGEPSESPARPGRKRGDGHARARHRRAWTDPAAWSRARGERALAFVEQLEGEHAAQAAWLAGPQPRHASSSTTVSDLVWKLT